MGEGRGRRIPAGAAAEVTLLRTPWGAGSDGAGVGATLAAFRASARRLTPQAPVQRRGQVQRGWSRRARCALVSIANGFFTRKVPPGSPLGMAEGEGEAGEAGVAIAACAGIGLWAACLAVVLARRWWRRAAFGAPVEDE